MADRPNKPNRPIRPRQGAPAGRRKRRVVIDTGAARPRQDGRQRRDQQEQKPKEKTPVAPLTGPVTVESGVTVKDLSQALGVPVPKLITILMGLGAAKTVTQSLADEEVQLIGTEVGREVNIKHAADEELEPEVYEDDEADLTARPPVVHPRFCFAIRTRTRRTWNRSRMVWAVVAASASSRWKLSFSTTSRTV